MAVKALRDQTVPTVNPTAMRKLQKEREAAEKVLVANPKDAKTKKTLAKCDAGLAAYEKALSDAVDSFVAKLKELTAARTAVGKQNPLPNPIKKRLDQLDRIASSSRAPEIKDLEREAKRKTLHTNPSKLTRLLDDINEDVEAVNKLVEDVDAEIDRHFEAKITELGERIKKDLPDKVDGGDIMLSRDLTKFEGVCRKAHWKDFDKLADAFAAQCVTKAAEVKRARDINALRSDKSFKTLNGGKKLNLIEAALKDGSSRKEAEKELRKALDAQRYPDRSAWAKHLGMVGYSIIKRDSKYNIKIHITFDLNSWTGDAKKGVVSVQGKTANQVFEDLFKVDNSYQIHCTAEIKAINGKYPHVYLFGHENHWNNVPLNDTITAKKRDEIKAHCKAELGKFAADVKKAIKTAIDKDGDI